MTTPRRPSRRLATYALLTSLALAACAKKGASSGSGDEHAGAPGKAVAAAGAADATKVAEHGGEGGRASAAPGPVDKRKVIRTGRMELVIASYEETRDKLAAIVKQAGGYIDSTQVSHHRGAVSSATIVLRIPSEGFGSILAQLRALGEIAAEHTDAADVTDAYVDVAARLASAKVLEKRLLELAAERTGTVENLLAVERELARVRGEIEGFEGKIRQWDDQIAMSTLTIGLATRAPEIAASEPGLGRQISEGFASSIEALRAFGAGLAIAIVALLPWLAFGIPGFILGRRAWRRRAMRRIPVAIAQPAQPVQPVQPVQPQPVETAAAGS